MPSTRNDAILWYNVGEFGPAGFAVPNWSDDPITHNATIYELVDAIGRNLAVTMMHPDVDLRTPPSIDSIRRVQKLLIRARQVLAAKTKASNEGLFQPQHATPVPQVFRVYPCAYHTVRNTWMKSWAGLVLMALSEAMQHTENRRPFDVSESLNGLIGSYLTRIQVDLAMTFFGVPKEEANAPGYYVPDTVLATYDPAKFFTSTEMGDAQAPLSQVFTEDTLAPLMDGLLVTQLPVLGPYPSSLAGMGTGAAVAAGTTPAAASAAVPAFAPPPSV